MFQKFPQVSFILSTRNRREVLLHTLAQIERCGLARSEFDIHVVDNASTDGTAARVRLAFPRVKLLTLSMNEGSVAKNHALPHAMGRFVVFLDDDSYPMPGAVQRMVRHFEADATLGAATFTVTLPDGRRECSAYPNVFIGCGVGLRRRALRAVGGLPDDFFMQAEEYDLSLRLIDAGYAVQTFEDLDVSHLKTPRARVSARTMRLDVRNNLYLIVRRFPFEVISQVGWDWMKRYWWIAQTKRQTGAFVHGVIDGVLRTIMRPRRDAVSHDAFQRFAKLDETRDRMQRLVHDGVFDSQQPTKPTRVKRVVLVDCGKGIYAHWRACRELGIDVVAIADENLHHPARRYRGIRLVDDRTARSLRYDVAVVSNLSPVHAERRREQWRLTQDRPVIDLYEHDRYEVPGLRPLAASA